MKNLRNSICFTLFTILVINSCLTNARGKVKKNVEDNEDVDDGKDIDNMEIPADMDVKNNSCSARRSGSRMHEIQKATLNQYPFMAALMSSSLDYVCAGSMVANGLILTSAECSVSAIYALMNTTTAKKDSTTVVLNVLKTEKFPTNDKDVAVLFTKKLNSSIISKIELSNITKSDDITDIEAIGFGLNAEVGQPKELQYVGLDVGTLHYKNQAFLTCIDTKVPSCFRDKGGPVIIDKQMVGVINSGQDECTPEMTSKYDLSKPMITFTHAYVFKGWIKELLAKNKDDQESIDSFKRSRLGDTDFMLTAGADTQQIPLPVFLICIFFNFL